MRERPAAVVFPGQGSQRLGMARDFYDAYVESRRVFEAASQALGLDVARLCFEDEEQLARTEMQQPAILTAEIAMLEALRTHRGFAPRWFAGHSLGEYAALVAAGVLDVGAAVALVRDRGRLMQESVPLGEGGMTAVLKPGGLDVARLRALLAEPDGLDVDVANENSPDQVVLSGRIVELSRAGQRLKRDPDFARARLIPLRVSAPFHSRLMREAAERFRPLLEAASATWRLEAAPRVVSNVSGKFHRDDRDSVVVALVEQVASPVRWLECMRTLAACCDRIVEVGPGKPLSALGKSAGITIHAVSDAAAADAALAAR